MTEIQITATVINATLISMVLYFLKRWMNNVDRNAENNRQEIIKLVYENRAEYKETANKVYQSIQDLSGLVTDHNRRTSQLETRVGVIEALCNERHGDHSE